MTPPAPQIPTDPYTGWRLLAELIYPGSAGGERLAVWNPSARKTVLRAVTLFAILVSAYLPFAFSGLFTVTSMRILSIVLNVMEYLGVPMAIACCMAYWLFCDWEERRALGQWDELRLTSLDSRTLLTALLAGVLRPFFWVSLIGVPIIQILVFHPKSMFHSGELLLLTLAGLACSILIWLFKLRYRPFLIAIVFSALWALWLLRELGQSYGWLLRVWLQSFLEFTVIGILAGILTMLICARVFLDGKGLGPMASIAACADISLRQSAKLLWIAGIMFILMGAAAIRQYIHENSPALLVITALLVIAVIIVVRKGLIPRWTSRLLIETPYPLRAMAIAAVIIGPTSFLTDYELIVMTGYDFSSAWATLVILPVDALIAIFYVRTCATLFADLSQRIHGQA
ncbi:MAG: hypothetical protein NTX50_03495 [Candidatus Sumerlaeota bacterium]|nr:hypothetical protein [Candidatus Sumerlaeota bacterium]